MYKSRGFNYGYLLRLSRREYQTGEEGVFGYKPKALKLKQSEAESKISVNFKTQAENPNFYRLVKAYRCHGHKYAGVNPVPFKNNHLTDRPELNANRYGFENSEDLVNPNGIIYDSQLSDKTTLKEVQQKLEQTYCETISVEFESVESEMEQEWLYQKYESIINQEISNQEKIELASELIKSQNFDNFLANKFSTVKRYGGEGAETMMAFFLEVIKSAGNSGIKEVVIGMPHRGRLNLMTGLFKYPPVIMFRKMKGLSDFPNDQSGASDVLSHLTSIIDVPTSNGSTVHVSMLPNPSHLEAVNPVTCGKVRGRHLSSKKGDYDIHNKTVTNSEDILCIQVHGDAALTGQGINQETLQLSQAPHFSVGGSLHIVVNNQVGFTTPGDRGRTSVYCTDLAKMIGAPVIHVNGDSPESVIKATRLALEYQREFRKDIFVDLVCYRRHGHNELDDPTFTNPLLYKVIHARDTLPNIYANHMIENDLMTKDDISKVIEDHTNYCNEQMAMMETFQPKRTNLEGNWSQMKQPESNITEWKTGVSLDLLKYVGAQSVKIPEGFNMHNHLKKHLVEARLKKLTEGNKIDWGLAEALAVGSLLYQGFNVRFSGQDVGRATFSHRHAMLVDQNTNEVMIPLNNLEKPDGDKISQGNLEMANSILSEEAVLGFEFGMSIDSPNNLIIWEAQFGDFFNGAQIMFDTYVSSSESKWGLQSGLVLVLPHGMDGAGPEHSSCRIERWLQMTDSKEDQIDGDNVNWNVVNPTTAAQYFHLLRRQMVRNYRKPLVVISPKILLRFPSAMSNINEMGPDTKFQRVFGDSRSSVDSNKVKKVIFVSGKHYYALEKYADDNNITDVAIIRIEELCPFPTKDLQQQVDKYPNAKTYVWSQEEHRNMGCWNFVESRFRNLVGVNLKYTGRSTLCQPAVGIGEIHQKEAKSVIEQPFNI